MPPQAGLHGVITPVNVALFGYGPVARDFLELIDECGSELHRRYDLSAQAQRSLAASGALPSRSSSVTTAKRGQPRFLRGMRGCL